MNKALSISLALGLMLLVPLPAETAEKKARQVELTGWITDEWCGAKNAGAEGADCAKACAEQGADLVLLSKGDLYKISDKELALEHVGHKVKVTGRVAEDNVIRISEIERAKD